MQTVSEIIALAAAKYGWSSASDFHRALVRAGSDTTAQSAWNWWVGHARPTGVNAVHVADLCGVDVRLILEAPLRIETVS